MKKVLPFLLMILFPIMSFANDIETPQLSVEEYDPISKHFNTLVFNNKVTADENQYNKIINLLQTQLNASIGQYELTKNKELADYQVIFINIQPTYYETEQILNNNLSNVDWKKYFPEINPKLPKNKYADSSASYHFVSPWIRGTLYIKAGKPVGGVIVIPISRFARIDELYHSAHQEWDEFAAHNSTVLDEMSMPYEGVYESTLKLYKEIFLNRNYSVIGKKVDKNFWDKSISDKVEKIFITKEKSSLILARLASISFQTDFAPFELEVNHTWENCISESYIFYENLYNVLFSNLLKRTYAISNDNVNNLAPSIKELESIHKISGNYNCFSKFKEGKK